MIKPRFREGQIVRIRRQPDGARTPLEEGVVEEVVGPTEAGTGWALAVRVGKALWVLPEDDLDGATQGSPPPERVDTVELRLVTEIADSVEAAQAAERIDAIVRGIVGPSILDIEAERHWAEPFFYELLVSVRPLGAALGAFRALADAGDDGWLSCRDDGWRCDLWWSADDDEPGYLVPEVRGAEVSFLPWSSPAVRPEAERPLVMLSTEQ